MPGPESTSNATFLGARWIVLRAVGLVYILIFAGIIAQSQALIGPHGIAPIGDILGRMRNAYPDGLRRFQLAPSLFWFGSGKGMIVALEWAGLAAAVALVLNLWPRMALFCCWLAFLSFVSAWSLFSPAQLDDLMLETALLCIPFAPAGFRPGIGAGSPPRPIAVFMMRWLLFRVMFESGVVKLIGGDPHWRDFTAMDIMHETAPLPTFLGYLDHQLPHVFHVFEAVLTFTAELVAPLVSVFGGRRGRWFAFGVWVIFQAGIQLTTNFGWLNLAAIGLGVLLLDDQMLGLFRRKGDGRPPRLNPASIRLRFATPRQGGIETGRGHPTAEPRQVTHGYQSLSKWGLRAALCAHFYLTICYFVIIARINRGMPLEDLPHAISAPANLFWNFHSANGYDLYAKIGSVRHGVEFAGSNDAGRTWRTYDYRYVSQRVDRICPFLGPWFPRFDVTVQNMDWSENKRWLFQAIAGELLAGNPDVIALFDRDPFPDRPPSIIRMRYYRLAFTDLETYRRSGHFWRKEYQGDYLPMLHADERGQVVESNLAAGDEALRNGDFSTALAIYEREYKLGNPDGGFRLANLYGRGLGVGRDPRKALALYHELAARGEVEAEDRIGTCYEYGNGVPVDYDQAEVWYKAAAEHGSLTGLYNLGGLYAKDLVFPGNDMEGLTLLLEASQRARDDDPMDRYIRQDPAGYVKRLEERMTPWDISNAKLRASLRIRKDDPLGAASSPPNRAG